MEKNSEARMARILREAREAVCRTQEHVAEEADVSIQTVRRAEQTGRIGDESLRAICAVIGLDTEETKARAAAAAPEVVHERIVVPLFSRHELAAVRPREDMIDSGFGLLPSMGVMTIMGFMSESWSLSIMVGIVFAAPVYFLFDMFAFDAMKEMAAMRKKGSLFFRTSKLAAVLWMTVFSMAVFFMSSSETSKPQWQMVLGMVLTTVPVFMSIGVNLLLQHMRDQERKASLDAAKAAFDTGIPPLLAEIRTLIEGNHGPESTARLRGLVVQAAEMAREAERGNDAAALVLLEEDVARRLSGRKALMDYLRIAEAALSTQPRQERQQQDIGRAIERLEGRLSAYA